MPKTQPKDLSAKLAGLNIQGPAGAPSHATFTPQVRPPPAILKLPHELFYEITDKVLKEANRSAEDIRQGLLAMLNLALTCKTLERFCMPELLHVVELVSPAQALNLLRGIMRRPHLSGYIRSLLMVNMKHRPVQYSAKAKADIVRSDPVAQELLQSGTVRIHSIILARILRQLPNLELLRAPASAWYQVLHWPSHERIEGTSLRSVVLETNPEDEITIPPSDEVMRWSSAFRPGREPAALDALCLERQFPSEGNPIEWIKITSSLRVLTLSNFSIEKIASILRHFRLLEILAIEDTKIPVLEICSEIGSCWNLARTLKKLSINGMSHSQATGLEACAVYNAFVHFSKLEWLELPILVKMQVGKRIPIALPPRLWSLTVMYTTHETIPNWCKRFLEFLRHTIETAHLPASLLRIVVVWPDDVADLVDRYPVSGMQMCLIMLEAVCISKDIYLAHHIGHELPVPTQQLLQLFDREPLPGHAIFDEDDSPTAT